MVVCLDLNGHGIPKFFLDIVSWYDIHTMCIVQCACIYVYMYLRDSKFYYIRDTSTYLVQSLGT